MPLLLAHATAFALAVDALKPLPGARTSAAPWDSAVALFGKTAS